MSNGAEDLIQKRANVFALVADMTAIEAEIDGMKADNDERRAQGKDPAWGGTCFRDAIAELSNIAEALRTI